MTLTHIKITDRAEHNIDVDFVEDDILVNISFEKSDLADLKAIVKAVEELEE